MKTQEPYKSVSSRPSKNKRLKVYPDCCRLKSTGTLMKWVRTFGRILLPLTPILLNSSTELCTALYVDSEGSHFSDNLLFSLLFFFLLILLLFFSFPYLSFFLLILFLFFSSPSLFFFLVPLLLLVFLHFLFFYSCLSHAIILGMRLFLRSSRDFPPDA